MTTSKTWKTTFKKKIENGRRPNKKMEDNLKIMEDDLQKMEDDLKKNTN